MSVPSPSERSARLCVAAAVGLVSVIVNLHGIDLLDEGTILHIAERVSRGEILYRDVVTGLAPGTYLLLGLLFRIFGAHLLVGRLLASVTLTLAAVLVYGICRRFTGRGWAAATAIGFGLWQAFEWRYPHYSGQAMMLIFAGLLVYLGHLRRPQSRRLFVAALLFGAAFVFKQNYGALAILAFAGCEGLYALAAIGGRVEAFAPLLRRSLIAASGLLLPVVGCGLFFLVFGALDEFAYYSLVVPLTTTTDYYLLPYPSLFGTLADSPHIHRSLWSYSPHFALHGWLWNRGLLGLESSFAMVRLYYYLPVAFVLIAALAVARRAGHAWIRRDRLPLGRVALVLFAAALLLGVFPRCDFHHLLLAAGLAWVVATIGTAGLAARPARRPLAVAVVALLLLPTVAIAVVNLYAWIWHPDADERKTSLLRIDRALTRVEKEKRDELTEAIRQLDHYAAGGPFLAAPTPSLFYFLAEGRNPTRFPLILPGATDEGEIIDRLESAGVRHLVYSDASIDGRTVLQDLPRLATFIRRRYCMHPERPVLYRGENLLLLVPRSECAPAPPPTELGLAGSPLGDGHEGKSARWLPVANLVDHLAVADRTVVLARGERRQPSLSSQVRRAAWMLEETVFQAPGSGLHKLATTFGVGVPPAAALEVGVGMQPEVWFADRGDGAVFEIYAELRRTGDSQQLLSVYIDPKNRPQDRRWRRYRIDLGHLAGEVVDLSLVTWGGPRLNFHRGEPRRGFDHAGWADPRIVVYCPDGDEAGCRERDAARPIVRDDGRLTDTAARAIAMADQEPHLLAELEIEPGDLDVRFALGQLYSQRGEVTAAARELRAAFDGGFRSRWTLEPLLFALTQLRDDAALEEVLGAALEAEPNDARLLARRADLLLRRQSFDEAAELYGRLVQDDDGPMLRVGLAEAFLGAGRVEQALDQAENLVADRATEPAALYRLGWALRGADELETARRSFAAAVERTPDPPAGYFTAWSYTLTHLERPQEAVEALVRGLEIHPTEPRLLSSVIPILWQLDRVEEACRYAETAARAQMVDTNVLFYRGQCLRALGQTEDALAKIEEVVERLGSGARPLHLRAWAETLVELGRLQEALAVNATARQRFPEESFFDGLARELENLMAGRLDDGA